MRSIWIVASTYLALGAAPCDVIERGASSDNGPLISPDLGGVLC